MVLFNYASREITAKLVYYGPGLCGKTTNLQLIHSKLDPNSRGKLLSLATDSDRTLFFDFLPLDLGSIGGYNARFQLYTVPGQVHYNATRKLVLKGVDALVFVADSQVEMLEANRESFNNLGENLLENGYEMSKLPIVIQLNKRDLPNAAPPEEILRSIGAEGYQVFEAVANTGEGVFETLKAIIRLSMAKLKDQFREDEPVEEKEISGPAAVEEPVAEAEQPPSPELVPLTGRETNEAPPPRAEPSAPLPPEAIFPSSEPVPLVPSRKDPSSAGDSSGDSLETAVFDPSPGESPEDDGLLSDDVLLLEDDLDGEGEVVDLSGYSQETAPVEELDLESFGGEEDPPAAESTSPAKETAGAHDKVITNGQVEMLLGEIERLKGENRQIRTMFRKLSDAMDRQIEALQESRRALSLEDAKREVPFPPSEGD